MPIAWDEVPDCDPAAFTLVTAPRRFAERGDAAAGMDDAADSLEPLLELAAEQQAAGLGDAPWPPHYRKQRGEPARVMPSRRKGAKAETGGKAAIAEEARGTRGATEGASASKAPNAHPLPGKKRARKTTTSERAESHDNPKGKQTWTPPGNATSPTGRRQSKEPLITVAKAEHQAEALAGLERWKARHPEAAALLTVEDVLIDAMRGRSTTWTRIRLNLRHVPESERPAEEPPDPDYDPWAAWRRQPGAWSDLAEKRPSRRRAPARKQE
jgi:hypothetical protein